MRRWKNFNKVNLIWMPLYKEQLNICLCIENGLKCTQLCKLKSCSNQTEQHENECPHVEDNSETDDDDDVDNDWIQ